MPDATIDRNEDESQAGQSRRDLVDVLGADAAKDVVREALEQAGVSPAAQDWERRRTDFLYWLNRLERRVELDIDYLAKR